jgi:hypothetical protein
MLSVGNTVVMAGSLLLLFQGAAGPSAHGGERHVLLTNNTREPIVEIYISDTDVGDWQADLLGTDFLPPGESLVVNINSPNHRCRVDVRTVLDNGENLVTHGVNVCRAEGSAVSLR